MMSICSLECIKVSTPKVEARISFLDFGPVQVSLTSGETSAVRRSAGGSAGAPAVFGLPESELQCFLPAPAGKSE